jgi:hypothetical protein
MNYRTIRTIIPMGSMFVSVCDREKVEDDKAMKRSGGGWAPSYPPAPKRAAYHHSYGGDSSNSGNNSGSGSGSGNGSGSGSGGESGERRLPDYGNDHYHRDWPWLKAGGRNNSSSNSSSSNRERTSFHDFKRGNAAGSHGWAHDNRHEYGRYTEHRDDDEDTRKDEEDLRAMADMFDSGGHVMDPKSLDAGYVDKSKEAAEKYAKEQSQPKVPVFNVMNFIASAAKKAEEEKKQPPKEPATQPEEAPLAQELAAFTGSKDDSRLVLAEHMVKVSVDSLYLKLLSTNFQSLLAENSPPSSTATDGPKDCKLHYENEDQYINKFEPLLLAEVREAAKEAIASSKSRSNDSSSLHKKEGRSQRNDSGKAVPVTFVSLGDRSAPSPAPSSSSASSRSSAELVELKVVVSSDADSDGKKSNPSSRFSSELLKDDLVLLLDSSRAGIDLLP